MVNLGKRETNLFDFRTTIGSGLISFILNMYSIL